jgi:prepilin-type N-terminal cleavage/methylation domain-containing protein
MTLIELLVVLVLLAIVASLAAPNASRWIESYTVRKASRQLVSDLQLTKLKAISQGVQHRILFDPANKKYTIQKLVLGVWTQVDVPRVLTDANLYGATGVALTNTFTNNAVIFSTTGTASPAGTVTLTTTNYSRQVTVILTGRISVG